MSHVVVISGSPSRNSRTAHVLEQAGKLLEDREISVSIVNVLDIPAEDLVLGRYDSEAVQSVSNQIQSAEGVILGTPVYKASYTGVLKSLLDLLDRDALAEKVILPIALGGSPAHFLMIDYALKPVLNTLGARLILGGVYILDTQVSLEEGKQVKLADEAEVRLRKALYEFSSILARNRFPEIGAAAGKIDAAGIRNA